MRPFKKRTVFPHPDKDEDLIDEYERATAFNAGPMDEVRNKLLLDYSWRKYDERYSNITRLMDRRDDLLKFVVTGIPILFAVLKLAEEPNSPEMTLAFTSFGIALLILTFSRRVFDGHAAPSIQSIREGLDRLGHEEHNPTDWIAKSLHVTIQALARDEAKIARYVNRSIWFMAGGICALLVLVWRRILTS